MEQIDFDKFSDLKRKQIYKELWEHLPKNFEIVPTLEDKSYHVNSYSFKNDP